MATEEKSLRGFVVIALAVTVIWALLGLVAYFLFSNWEARGTFGDMFGSINVLFSGLALGAVVYTIHLQQQDLRIQREVQRIQLEDLKVQSQAAVSSAEQLAAQQQLLNFQICQDTVINLINIKNKFVEEFTFEMGTHMKGRKLIPDYVARGIEAVVEYYRRNTQPSRLEMYFNTFFYTLQFITDSNIDEKQKQVLADILNIQTTDTELAIIYRYYRDNPILNNSQHRLALLSKYNFDIRVN
ncbi:hypothetical protein [Bacillus sp. FSL K6-6540]|uniref:hypothetical protein n=1 Tax=Bacillus sp. FSL K6-6540 TaxID=2921512 RepID=UPI0030FC04A8